MRLHPRCLPVALLSLVLTGATGCLVLRSDYEAEVSRVRSLEFELARRDEAARALEREMEEHAEARERAELEKRALDVERVQLAESLEDLRLANERLREGLLDERARAQQAESQIREIASTYQSLVEELEAEVRTGEIRIQELRGQVQVSAADDVLFDSGLARIKPGGERLLASVAEQIGKLEGYSVRVEGHTDDRPISTERFPSNWDLSAARAVEVVRFLVSAGVAPELLSAVGYGPYHPIVANDTPENRARNRRIEIVLVPDTPG